MYMWSMIVIIIVVVTIIIVIVVIIIIIPYEDMLMLLSDSACLSKGVVDPLWRQVDIIPYAAYLLERVLDLLAPYEDKLMWFLI